MKVLVSDLEQQVADLQQELPMIRHVMQVNPDMSRWQPEGRFRFMETLLGGMSCLVTLWAHQHGVEIVID